MDKNRNCFSCNIKIDKDNYKTDRTVCKSCYIKKKRKSNNKTLFHNGITASHQQPKNGKPKKINRTILVGHSFLGKTCFTLKIFSRIPNRDIYIITKSPPEQYSSSQIKIKEIGEEIKPLNEYEKSIIVFDDFLGPSNSRILHQFFIIVRHNNLDIYYPSQSYFDLPKRTIRNNSNKKTLITQTLKDIEYIYRDVGGFDMIHDEFKEICRKTLEEEFNYLCIDRSRKKDQGRYCFHNESKIIYTLCASQTTPF